MNDEPKETPSVSPANFLRVPGLFRRWEIEQVLEAGADFHLEEAGTASDGTPLYAIFRRQPDATRAHADQGGAP